jgi:hypothetical protein
MENATRRDELKCDGGEPIDIDTALPVGYFTSHHNTGHNKEQGNCFQGDKQIGSISIS